MKSAHPIKLENSSQALQPLSAAASCDYDERRVVGRERKLPLCGAELHCYQDFFSSDAGATFFLSDF